MLPNIENLSVKHFGSEIYRKTLYVQDFILKIL
jgi:hypothetical protein